MKGALVTGLGFIAMSIYLPFMHYYLNNLQRRRLLNDAFQSKHTVVNSTNKTLHSNDCCATPCLTMMTTTTTMNRTLGIQPHDTYNVTTTHSPRLARLPQTPPPSSSSSSSKGFVFPNRLFGHLHMAKTAGTTLNGELAARFERVCGHKGYSYDFTNTNKRTVSVLKENMTTVIDSISKLHGGYYRGRVPHSMMVEIGFHDCDYVSHEIPWTFWRKTFAKWPIPVELHVPCRDPVELLMSMCNYKKIHFPCDNHNNETELLTSIKSCLIELNRFDLKLRTVRNFSLKCFASENVTRYVEYMSSFLQAKRFRTTYRYRATNDERRHYQAPNSTDQHPSQNNTGEECIWSHPALQQTMHRLLVENFPYFKFCHKCLNSPNDLFFQSQHHTSTLKRIS